jgi:hypothetical protein
MDNERKLEDIVSEMYIIYCKRKVPKTNLKHLISNIESYISYKDVSKNDNYFNDIYHIYKELNTIPVSDKTGRINKILFNQLYKNIKEKYDYKKSKSENNKLN